ncbi:MAG: hypothetical protein WAM92_08060, partial [Mycobacterium sp.]
MSLICRAIWQDREIRDVCQLAQGTFTSWVNGKWGPITIPDNGTVHAVADQHGEKVDLEVRTASAADAGAGIPHVYRAELIETHQDAARWHVTLRSREAAGSASSIGP